MRVPILGDKGTFIAMSLPNEDVVETLIFDDAAGVNSTFRGSLE